MARRAGGAGDLNERRLERAKRGYKAAVAAVRTAELLLANRQRDLEGARERAFAAGLGPGELEEMLR